MQRAVENLNPISKMAPYWVKISPPSTTRHIARLAGDDVETMVTNDESSAAKWVHHVLYGDGGTPTAVALRTNYDSGSPPDRVATLQLCAGNKCLILQLFYMSYIPPSIFDFLEDPDIAFVGFGVKDDTDSLEDDYLLWCRNSVDLDHACRDYVEKSSPLLHRRRRRRQLGVKDYYALEILGLHMDKPGDVTTSDWDIGTLSEAQIRYASIDAYVCHRLGCKVLGKLVSGGR